MKIAVIIATRGHPERAAAILECARSLSSGNHELDVIVAGDADDRATFERFAGRERLSMAARPVCVPECWNRCLSLTDAEMILMLPDDGFPGTLHWDEAVALFATEGRYPRELAAFHWHDTANPGMPTIIGASREWIALTDGKLLDDRFPFWFSDIAFAETWSFVTGAFLPRLPITLNCQPNKPNQRLRDMGFWWDFYAFTRAQRLAQSAVIRSKLGLPTPDDLEAFIRSYEERDARGRPSSLHFDAPPTPQYPEAYRRAANVMAQHERSAA